MPETKPPDWENDPLSEFFKLAEHNHRVASLYYPAVFELLKQVELTFKEIQKAIEYDSKPVLIFPRFLIVRTHGSFLAALRLAMSGQIAEAYPVLRQAIEQAWYALHIAKDPFYPSRMEIWRSRNEDMAAKTKCKQEFTIANVRATHETLDPDTAKHLQQLYEFVIDFGAHPNQLGVLAGIAISEGDKRTDYKVGIICHETLPMLLSIRLIVAVAVGALKIFQQIFPERFEIMSIDKKIEELVPKLNSVFNQYLQE